ncbi:MAG: hypothetical protein H6Q16_231 [Bacteroidetes bacterium]|nr:hypothetical protein [Bacteroidota bacterium]
MIYGRRNKNRRLFIVVKFKLKNDINYYEGTKEANRRKFYSIFDKEFKN